MSEKNDKQAENLDRNTELAKERTHDAFERTLMAWIRTGLALIGFGIGIIEFTEKTDGTSLLRSSRLIGLLFILLGIFSIVFAIRDNKINHRRLLRNEILYNRKSSLGIRVGYALIGIGILAIIHIIYKFFQL
jgi:putative membrane protein